MDEVFQERKLKQHLAGILENRKAMVRHQSLAPGCNNILFFYFLPSGTVAHRNIAGYFMGEDSVWENVYNNMAETLGKDSARFIR